MALNNMTLRVSGIPATMVEDEFIQTLEACLASKYPRDSEGNHIASWSFAPAAASLDRDKYRVATITFDEPVKPLRQVRKLSIDSQGQSYELHLDSDFYGLTPLYHSSTQPEVDIVAVTGPNGHPFQAWQSTEESTMWLRDFLPKSVRPARILTFGYDSTPTEDIPKPFATDFSHSLLEQLVASRANEDEKQRPIIFIGHSLGGILVKEALVWSDRGGPKEKLIYLSCYGLIFLGVPNRGFSIDALRNVVKGEPTSQVYLLGPSSAVLDYLHDNFCFHFTHEDSEVISVYETMYTKTLVEAEDGRWENTGPPVLVVPKYSATCSVPTEKRWDQVPLNTDHEHLIKFRNQYDSEFIIIRSRIAGFANKAPEAILKRFNIAKEDFQLQLYMPDYATRDSTGPTSPSSSKNLELTPGFPSEPNLSRSRLVYDD